MLKFTLFYINVSVSFDKNRYEVRLKLEVPFKLLNNIYTDDRFADNN